MISPALNAKKNYEYFKLFVVVGENPKSRSNEEDFIILFLFS